MAISLRDRATEGFIHSWLLFAMGKTSMCFVLLMHWNLWLPKVGWSSYYSELQGGRVRCSYRKLMSPRPFVKTLSGLASVCSSAWQYCFLNNYYTSWVGSSALYENLDATKGATEKILVFRFCCCCFFLSHLWAQTCLLARWQTSCLNFAPLGHI